MPRCLLLPLLCALALGLHAQSLPNLWLHGSLQYRSAKRLFLESDASVRGGALGTRFYLAHLRAGAGLQWSSGFATAGAAWFQSLDTTGVGRDRGELRLYQRLQLRQPLGPLELTHVYRAEERWIEQANSPAYDLRFRFRYLVQGIWKWKSAHLLKATPYAVAHVETMLSPDDRVFSQFRLYGGAGLDWQQGWRWEIGFLNAWLPATAGTTQQSFVRMNIMRTLSRNRVAPVLPKVSPE